MWDFGTTSTSDVDVKTFLVMTLIALSLYGQHALHVVAPKWLRSAMPEAAVPLMLGGAVGAVTELLTPGKQFMVRVALPALPTHTFA